MELGVNIGILAALGLAWSVMAPGEISADFSSSEAARLGALEHSLGAGEDLATLIELSEGYLQADRPAAALALLRAASPHLLEHPSLGNILARSYEGLGRFEDALASARLSLDRCARALGASNGPQGTAVPRYRCGARDYARLSVHHGALQNIVAWGIVRLRDPRSAQAYDLALRRARVAAAPAH